MTAREVSEVPGLRDAIAKASCAHANGPDARDNNYPPEWREEDLAEADAIIAALRTLLTEHPEAIEALTSEGSVLVPRRFVDEVALALDAATTIGIRSCDANDGLDVGNHDRLIREAQQWSPYARGARSLPISEEREG